eukprot:s2776_g7.t1
MATSIEEPNAKRRKLNEEEQELKEQAKQLRKEADKLREEAQSSREEAKSFREKGDEEKAKEREQLAKEREQLAEKREQLAERRMAEAKELIQMNAQAGSCKIIGNFLFPLLVVFAFLQDWCSQLLRQTLRFGIAEKLLATDGATWDYCGKDKLWSAMQETVQTLHDNKGVNSHKQRHPLFLVFAGPGQGKSRFLTEFPSLVGQCLKSTKNLKYNQKPVAFLLTCENGTQPGDWLAEELNPRRFVACRMLWQLREANEEPFCKTGAPTDFAQFRAGCSKNLTPKDVLDAILSVEEMKAATIVIGIDGMQNLPGFTQRAVEDGKKEPFYQVMGEVCRLINQKEAPFVVGCVTATQSMDHGLATSPQARRFLELPRVTQVTVNNVDQIPYHPLKHLLVMDMGGHGRALECLVNALTKMQFASGDAVVGAVMADLFDKYPNAGVFGRSDSRSFDDSDIKGILRASLCGKWIARGSTIANVNPEKMMLIRLNYNSGQTEYRIDLPYIWLHMMLSRHTISYDLQSWRLMDYSSFLKDALTDGREWELFNANFRVLRSHAFEDMEEISVASLHRGAIINEPVKSMKVVNRHLKLGRAKAKSASRSSCCGNPKPFKGSNEKAQTAGLQTHQCKAIQDDKEITVTMTDKTILLLNANGAPAAHAFLMLDQVTPNGARGDILVLLRNTRDKAPTSKNGHIVFVSEEQFEAYFGLYAGRAFNAARRFTAVSSKKCVKSLPRQVSASIALPQEFSIFFGNLPMAMELRH